MRNCKVGADVAELKNESSPRMSRFSSSRSPRRMDPNSDLSSVGASRKPFPWLVGAYAAFAVQLVVVLSLAGWSAYVDFEESRISELQSNINKLRSHALRTVALIQDQLSGKPGGLDNLGDVDWLREHWQRSVPNDPSRLYAAVVDREGRVIIHFDRRLEGGKLPTGWYTHPVTEAGEDVMQTSNPELTGGQRALDISIPIVQGEREIGTYHSGFNLPWFETKLAERQTATRNRWIVVFALIAAVQIAGGVSLVRIARRLSSLQADVAMGHVRRLAELGQVSGGIAHEIRNPLNAVRLNLHVVRKLWSNRSENVDRVNGIIDETVHEIERVDGLLRSLLEYARPERAQSEAVNLAGEVRSVVSLLQPLLERDHIRVDLDLPDDGGDAHIDRGRFRQIVLNLLKNAMEAIETDGRINVTLRPREADVSLVVADEGPGIPPSRRDRIFDPFFTTKELGTGLGLTLVRRFVEEAGGTIRYTPGSPVGSVFTVALPRNHLEKVDDVSGVAASTQA
jgi:two-component system, NtrC family, sensor histidine kinase HydH